MILTFNTKYICKAYPETWRSISGLILKTSKESTFYGGIFLPPTCKIITSTCQTIMLTCMIIMLKCKIIMLKCKLQIFLENLIFIQVKWLTNVVLRHHRCKLQLNYDNMRLVYVDMRLIYVNIRVHYVNMQYIECWLAN